MTIFLKSACSEGVDCSLIDIEVDFAKGFSGTSLIGSHSEICRNGLERAKLALESIGLELSNRKIVISLSPAEVKKDGSQFDLAFALGLALLQSEQRANFVSQDWLIAGELGLDGLLKPVKNVVSYALEAAQNGMKGILVAPQNKEELLVLKALSSEIFADFKILSFSHLDFVLKWAFSMKELEEDSVHIENIAAKNSSANLARFEDMQLNADLKKIALTIAVGHHSLLLYGAPGSGKSMFSERLPSILPALSKPVHLESLRVYSSLSERIPQNLIEGRPPYRSPHHQSSPAAVLGVPDAPGEISLAHGGILFLDELPEFRRDIIEALREPLETGFIHVSRARRKVVWKSSMILIAACNLCPCGWFGSLRKKCSCAVKQVLNYRRRISGPILDRIDIHYNMPEPSGDMSSFLICKEERQGFVKSKDLKALAEEAILFSKQRNKKFGIRLNRELKSSDLKEASGLSDEKLSSLINNFCKTPISFRSIAKCLRLARTLADLDSNAIIREEDFFQAWQWMHDRASELRGDQSLGLV